MAGNVQGPRTTGVNAQAVEQEPAQLRSAIVSAIASIDADLAEIVHDKEPSRENTRPDLPLPEPDVLRAQRLKRLKELRSVFTAIKRRLDRSRR